MKTSHSTNAAVGSRYVPCRNPKLVDALGSRAYCGRFSRSGNVFAVACQDRRIHVYDTSNDAWGVRGVVNARALRWTVTDCAVSPVDGPTAGATEEATASA